MEQESRRIEFRFGKAGKLLPLLVAAAMIGWAAVSQSNVNGYVLAFFAALVTGVIFAKDEKAYGEALVYGLSKPMFAVIVLAVILAAVSGRLISASGAVQTIAAYVVAAGFTGKLFVAAMDPQQWPILPQNCSWQLCCLKDTQTERLRILNTL